MDVFGACSGNEKEVKTKYQLSKMSLTNHNVASDMISLEARTFWRVMEAKRCTLSICYTGCLSHGVLSSFADIWFAFNHACKSHEKNKTHVTVSRLFVRSGFSFIYCHVFKLFTQA